MYALPSGIRYWRAPGASDEEPPVERWEDLEPYDPSSQRRPTGGLTMQLIRAAMHWPKRRRFRSKAARKRYFSNVRKAKAAKRAAKAAKELEADAAAALYQPPAYVVPSLFDLDEMRKKSLAKQQADMEQYAFLSRRRLPKEDHQVPALSSARSAKTKAKACKRQTMPTRPLITRPKRETKSDLLEKLRIQEQQCVRVQLLPYMPRPNLFLIDSDGKFSDTYKKLKGAVDG